MGTALQGVSHGIIRPKMAAGTRWEMVMEGCILRVYTENARKYLGLK
jgi:hypothetical protein